MQLTDLGVEVRECLVGIILTKVSLVVVGVHERFFEFLIYKDTGVGLWGTANELFTIAAGL